MITEISPILFETKTDWADWLELHPDDKEIWVRMAHKASKIKSIYYEDALEVALCYGWIDGIRKKYDEVSFIQRFTPRKTKSIWSLKNKTKVLELITEGRMQPLGMATIEAAKKNGNWEAAYSSSSIIEVPDDFKSELKKNSKANAFFETLNRQNRYAILHRIEKSNTKEKRKEKIEKFISMLEENKRLY